MHHVLVDLVVNISVAMELLSFREEPTPYKATVYQLLQI